MINSKKLSTTCYTINRVYLRPDTNKIAYELWKGKKSNLSYFHVFGCTCYILNDKEHLGKFQAKSDKCIFLGYSLNSRAYRIFNLRTKIIMESINVVVDDLTDVTEPFSERDAVDLTDEIEKQFQNSAITPFIATETESSIEATSATKPVDITDQTTRDSSTRI